MIQRVKIWYDTEGDFLEVLFSDAAGFLRETANDAVMERIDEKGEILGFTVMKVSEIAMGKPLVADLVATAN